jgi:hypothetical protein
MLLLRKDAGKLPAASGKWWPGAGTDERPLPVNLVSKEKSRAGINTGAQVGQSQQLG